MLRELFIHNIAIIDDFSVKLSPGLNVITGETGAGKSVIIGALGLLLGFRASNDILRTGCENGFVSGAFEIDAAMQARVTDLAIPEIEDGILVLSRELSRESRNVCRINEKIVSLSGFRAVGSMLIDIYGQNEEQGLLLPDNQLAILDQLGGGSLLEWKQAVAQGSKNIRNLDTEIEEQERQQQEVREKSDFLEFQLNELAGAQLKDVNEADVLEEQIRILAGAEDLAQNSLVVYSLLFGSEAGGGSVYDKISKSLSVIETMTATDASLQDKAASLQEILYSVQDISEFFRDYAQGIESDPQKLEILQDRLVLIKGLESKYRRSVEELILFRDEIAAVLEGHVFSEERLVELRQEREAAKQEYLAAAEKLSVRRQETGDYLAQHVAGILNELEMKDAHFEAAFAPALAGRESYYAFAA